MTDLESPAASAVESPEDFVRLVFADDGIPEYEVEHSNLGRNLADGIRSRDRAVRREALAEAARWLAQKVADVREVTRDCRREAIALKGSGKDWQDAFQRECLSASRWPPKSARCARSSCSTWTGTTCCAVSLAALCRDGWPRD